MTKEPDHVVSHRPDAAEAHHDNTGHLDAHGRRDGDDRHDHQAGHDSHTGLAHYGQEHKGQAHRADGHTAHAHQGHEPDTFRRRFWLSLALTIPILYFSDQIQTWLGY